MLVDAMVVVVVLLAIRFHDLVGVELKALLDRKYSAGLEVRSVGPEGASPDGARWGTVSLSTVPKTFLTLRDKNMY